MTIWRNEITEEIASHGDGLTNLTHWAINALTLGQMLDHTFENSHGATKGQPFTLWT